MKGSAALRASLRLASSIVSITDLAAAGTLSGNNARETARQMQEDINTAQEFVRALLRAAVNT